MQDSLTMQRSNSLEQWVREVSERLTRLYPDRRDPEAYHAEKSAIVYELRRLGDAIREKAR